MGSLTYDGMIVHLEDRALTHLQIVIVNKFRKGESFLMSWKDAAEVGDGRSAVWMHPHMQVYFKFEGSRVPVVNTVWLAELVASADSSRGLIVTDEKGAMFGLDRGPARAPGGTRISPAPDPGPHTSG
jgi:hypothetical protein